MGCVWKMRPLSGYGSDLPIYLPTSIPNGGDAIYSILLQTFLQCLKKVEIEKDGVCERSLLFRVMAPGCLSACLSTGLLAGEDAIRTFHAAYCTSFEGLG